MLLLKVEDEPGFDLPGLHFVNRGVDLLELATLIDHRQAASASGALGHAPAGPTAVPEFPGHP
jgi:hypothetical protein